MEREWEYSRFEQHNDDSSSSVSPIIAAADVIIDFFIFDLDFGILNSLEIIQTNFDKIHKITTNGLTTPRMSHVHKRRHPIKKNI